MVHGLFSPHPKWGSGTCHTLTHVRLILVVIYLLCLLVLLILIAGVRISTVPLESYRQIVPEVGRIPARNASEQIAIAGVSSKRSASQSNASYRDSGKSKHPDQAALRAAQTHYLVVVVPVRSLKHCCEDSCLTPLRRRFGIGGMENSVSGCCSRRRPTTSLMC